MTYLIFGITGVLLGVAGLLRLFKKITTNKTLPPPQPDPRREFFK